MVTCNILKNGAETQRFDFPDSLTFEDSHGIECNSIVSTSEVRAACQEINYDRYSLFHTHYQGKESHTVFQSNYNAHPSLLFSIINSGEGLKSLTCDGDMSEEIYWKAGEARLCMHQGAVDSLLHLRNGLDLEMTNIILHVDFAEELLQDNAELTDYIFGKIPSQPFSSLKSQAMVSKEVVQAANDINRCRLMGINAHSYLESKIKDCLLGIFHPELLRNDEKGFNHTIRDKIHDAKDIILAQYQDMPSLHDLASMVGTNECTLKKAFKQEFGTTVFQYLFDYRMDKAAQYLLDTDLPISDIGIRLGYDYQSHFCTAFKRKYGMTPMEFRLRK